MKRNISLIARITWITLFTILCSLFTNAQSVEIYPLPVKVKITFPGFAIGAMVISAHMNRPLSSLFILLMLIPG